VIQVLRILQLRPSSRSVTLWTEFANICFLLLVLQMELVDYYPRFSTFRSLPKQNRFSVKILPIDSLRLPLLWRVLTQDSSPWVRIGIKTDWKLKASVPSAVRKCAVPPDYLRSEILFSRTCNIPNLISCTSYIPHSRCNARNVSLFLCLHGCTIACAIKQTFAQCKLS